MQALLGRVQLNLGTSPAERRALTTDARLAEHTKHGGDPDSVFFCHKVGMDYVSCSPFRVPIARLAAAQAVLREMK